MNPPVREGDRAGWGRYDVPGHRTVYGADPEEASYGESLAALRPAFAKDTSPLDGIFDDLPSGDAVLAAVEKEWAERNHMATGTVNAGWRHERLLYTLQLPSAGWFVDIETVESIAAISAAIGGDLARLGLDALTVGDLRGQDRSVTTMVAEWVRAQTLDDGSLPHGIRFGSKHDSTWTCYAIWLRRVDDGAAANAEVTSADAGQPIEDPDHNPALERIARLFQLTVF